MVLKINIKKLLVCLAVPLAVGGLSALISGGGMEAFESMNQPPLSPPGWLFPVVWSILYLLMGYAWYRVSESGAEKSEIASARMAYTVQLVLNFFWSIWFFNLGLYWFSFVWLIALWAAILITLIRFWRVDTVAGYLLIPYLVWVTFAGYLNLGIAILN